MITFVQDSTSLFGEEFCVSQDNKNPPHTLIPRFFSDPSIFISEFHYKEGFGIEDMSQWEATSDGVGVGTFKNIFGKKFAIRLDLIQSAAAKFGREKCLRNSKFPNWKPHIFIPYSEESKKRGVNIENAVGFFIVSSKKSPTYLLSFVVVEIVPNCTKIGEITGFISFQMGKILSDTHKAGIVHGHPHLGNWVAVDGKPRLVDGKGVLLDTDFPWYTCTGRTHTFDNMAANDNAHVLLGELGASSPENFDAFNDGYRSI